MKINYRKIIYCSGVSILVLLLLLSAFYVRDYFKSHEKQSVSLYFTGGSSNNFPPMNLIDKNGDLKGFGKDLSDAVIDEIGGSLKHIHSSDWSQVLDWLDSGKVDFIHDTGYTKERDRYLDYTNPIIEMPEVIFVRTEQYAITDFDSLKGKTVACVNKHITHQYLKKHPEIKCYVVKTPVQGLYELIAGKADAFVYPKQIILYLIQQLRLGDKVKITGKPLRTLSWSMVVKEGNTEMLQLINKGIARVHESGEYDHIYNRWWGKKVLAGYSKQELRVITVTSTIISIVVVLSFTLFLVNTRLRRSKKELEDEISERMTIEETLQLSENRYRMLVENLPQRIFYKNPNLEYITCNENFAADLNISHNKITGKTDYDFFPKELAEKYREDDLRIIRSRGTEELVEKYIIDGREYVVQTVKTVIRNAEGDVSGLLGIFWDITESKHAEEELKRLRNLLSNIINSMPSIIVGVDNNGRIIQWNRQAEKLTGTSAEKARGQLISEVFPVFSPEINIVRAAIESQETQKDLRVENVIKGQTHFSDIMVYPLISNGTGGAVIRIDDITERVEIEELMIQSEKMLSVGGLAAGMAHEINNPLSGILQNTQVIRRRISSDLKKNRHTAEECGVTIENIQNYMNKRGILKMIDSVEDSGKRAAKIVENMLSFSRKSEPDFAFHYLDELLEKTVGLAENDYDLKSKYDFRKIRIVREYDSLIPQIPCEGTKIQQVFLNVLKNAAQAISEIDAPCITLRLRSEDDMVRIEIQDNGPGMNDFIRKKIFEPFYTTKAVGAGTGLGLSVSYFIITENHNGTMSVESAPGHGAKFIIRLPKKRIQ